MSYKVHDKFIIEIAECIKGYGNNPEAPDPLNLPVLYRIKGFNALVFDKFGLDKLEKFEEEKYPPSELEKFRQEAFNAGMKCIGIHDIVVFDDKAKEMMTAVLPSFLEAIDVFKNEL